MTDLDAWRLAAALSASAVVERPLPPAPVLAGDRWRALVTMVVTERVSGPLARAVQTGHLAVDEEQADEARRLHRRAMATALVLDRALLDVARRFRSGDIDFVVLKGSAAAHLDYETPSMRSYGDVDLLVRGPQMDDARRVLEAVGGRRLYPQRQEDFDRRFTKSVTMRMPDGVEIDLHRTLAPGPFGLAIDLRELATSPATFPLGGAVLPALDRSRRFVHACYHATLGRSRTRLVPLCDVVVTAPRDEREVHEVDALVRHWSCQPVVGRALDLAVETLGWSLPPTLGTWRDELPVDPRRQRWLAAYTGAGRSDRRLAFYSMQALPRWRERVAYGAAVARSSVASRHLAERAARVARTGTGTGTGASRARAH